MKLAVDRRKGARLLLTYKLHLFSLKKWIFNLEMP